MPPSFTLVGLGLGGNFLEVGLETLQGLLGEDADMIIKCVNLVSVYSAPFPVRAVLALGAVVHRNDPHSCVPGSQVRCCIVIFCFNL